MAHRRAREVDAEAGVLKRIAAEGCHELQ